jgi:hypothetical protein
MWKLTPLLVLTLVAILQAVPAAAQQDSVPALAPGTLVRLEARLPSRLVGLTLQSKVEWTRAEVVEDRGDSLRLRRITRSGLDSPREVTLSYTDIREIHVRTGLVPLDSIRRRYVSQGALIGAGLGAGTMAAVGVWVLLESGNPDADPDWSRGRLAGRTAVLMLLAGAAGGALGGAAGLVIAEAAPRDRWQEYPIRSRGTQISVALPVPF